MKKRYKLLLWQNVYCANSHKMLFFGLIIIASFHVVGHKICNTLIFLSIIYVIKIFFKQFIPINFLEQKNLYDVSIISALCRSIPHIITAKLESKSVKNSHYQQDSIKIVLSFSNCSKRYTIWSNNKSGCLYNCARIDCSYLKEPPRILQHETIVPSTA